MGRVLAAEDPAMGRTVAVKVLHEGSDAPEARRKQFITEAQITAQLEHPHIVPVYDLCETEERDLFMVMRSIKGRSLDDVMTSLQQNDLETAARWTRHRLLTSFLKVCNAVAYAHAHGVLHRDLKPANIMLGDYGQVLVVDWGVAYRMDEQPHSAADPDIVPPCDELMVGTPGYMSPEQVAQRAGELDARTDVWSLGAILYEILTHQPAYSGVNLVELLHKTMEGRLTNPPGRAPGLDISPEIADVCMRALSPKPCDRYASATELSDAVDAFLEGTRRRELAVQCSLSASATWGRYEVLGRERDALLLSAKRLSDAADAWAPLEDRKELLSTRDAVAELELRRARVFGEFIEQCEKALAHDSAQIHTRALMADAYWVRLTESELQRDAAAVAFYTDRVAAFDDGAYTRRLEGTGTLSLRTDPPGAEVSCERFEQRGLVYPLVERRVLGKTPIARMLMPMGSYLLTIRHPDARETRYPVHITRCRDWDSGKAPIRLYADDEVGAGFKYVPAGPFISGGDDHAPGSKLHSEPFVDGVFVASYPVSMRDYLEFLDALHERDPELAWRRAPRSESSLSDQEGQYVDRPARGARYVMPDSDADGNPWHPEWPVFGVSWHDACAYAAWLSERDGRTYRLPLELELEKAARGVDGRYYPWGDGFDRTLCKMGDSRRGRPRPEPIGAFKTDVSAYGVRDLAGSMRDWCGDVEFDGDSTLRAVRGGSWNYDPRFCRASCRLGRPPWRIFAYNGFRLARTPSATSQTTEGRDD